MKLIRRANSLLVSFPLVILFAVTAFSEEPQESQDTPPAPSVSTAVPSAAVNPNESTSTSKGVTNSSQGAQGGAPATQRILRPVQSMPAGSRAPENSGLARPLTPAPGTSPAQGQPNPSAPPLQQRPNVPPQQSSPPQQASPQGAPLPQRPESEGAAGTSQSPLPPPQPSQPVVTATLEAGKKLYHLNFDDADIYAIIHTIFGDVLKVNYVIDSRIKGRASFKSVTGIPLENVLSIMEVVLRLNDIAVVERNNLYRIVPMSEIAREPSAVGLGREQKDVSESGKALLQVVPVNHMQSSEMVRLIAPFISAHASVVDVSKINHIVVADTDINVKRLLRLIEIFDSEQQKRKGPQVYVYPVQHNKAKDIANTLQQIFLAGRQQTDRSMPQPPAQQVRPYIPPASTTTSQPPKPSTPSGSAVSPPPPPQVPTPSASAPQTTRPQVPNGVGAREFVVSDITRIMYDEIINSVIVLGTPEDYEIIKETIQKIDIIPRQVLLEGMIAEVTLTDKLSLGIRWAINANIFGTNTGITLNKGNTEQSAGLQIIGTDSGGNIQGLLTTLATESRAKLLASPHIMVSDNHEARIQVGQSVPIPTSETYGTPGIAPQRTIQYKDIGIILKVKPQISDSGQVTLDISQEVSTFSTITLYANEQQIILNKTDASTNLFVQDGQTIIIGGLIREDTSKSRAGIPFLSKIPIIGYLFGNTDKSDSRTEIVILLTPRVVKSQADSSSLTSGYVDDFTQKGSEKDIKKGDLLKKRGSPGTE